MTRHVIDIAQLFVQQDSAEFVVTELASVSFLHVTTGRKYFQRSYGNTN